MDRITAIIGSTGTGKTTLMARLIRRHLSSGSGRVIILDTMKSEALDGLGVEVSSFQETLEYAYRTQRFCIRWVNPPRGETVIDSISYLALERGDVLVAVDEIQHYVRKQWNAIPKSFQDCCLVGRHRGVSLIATSQRPSLIHNDFLSQAHRYFVFRVVLKDDIEALSHLIDTEGITRLKTGEYLTFPEEQSKKAGGNGVTDETVDIEESEES